MQCFEQDDITYPEDAITAIDITLNASLRIIDDYLGYPELQQTTAEDIVAELYEPGQNFTERLVTYEYANRSQVQLLTDEFELSAALFRLERWRTRVAGRVGAGALFTSVRTTVATNERTTDIDYAKPSLVPA